MKGSRNTCSTPGGMYRSVGMGNSGSSYSPAKATLVDHIGKQAAGVPAPWGRSEASPACGS